MMITCVCGEKFETFEYFQQHRQISHRGLFSPEIERLKAWILFLGVQAPELKHYCYDALHTTQNPPEVKDA
jgi:hypothetical protein